MLPLFFCGLFPAPAAELTCDVLVYGGTPGGVAAAVAAGRQGEHVILAEPQYFVGGMMAGGLTKTDIGNRSTLGGLSKEFFARVLTYYEKTYGEQSVQARETHAGAFFEPHVAALIFRQMLDEAGVRVLLKHRLESADLAGQLLRSVTLRDADEREIVVRAGVFIDASYEGDLLAAAHVPYRVGREARGEFHESLAGVTAGPEQYLGTGDHRVQSYNIRSTITNRADVRLPFPKPAHYTPEPFRSFVDAVLKRHVHTFEDLFHDAPDWGPVNGKYDPNKADAVGFNFAYVEGDDEARARIVQRLRDYWLSMWYMLGNDPALPEDFRQSVANWGLPKDEFTESGHVSPQPYVRVGRRMLGRYLLTQNDVEDDRFKEDAVCLGSYTIDCHPIEHIMTEKGIVAEGSNSRGIDPYEIPYRCLTPFSPQNLLAVCAVSATHIAYGTLRMEPVFMMIGDAAGNAADLAIKDHTSVQNIPVKPLQERLRAGGIQLTAPFRPKVAIRVKTPPPYQLGQEIVLAAETVRARGPIQELQWNFDGTGAVQATGAEVRYRPDTARTCHVTLAATDADGFVAMPATGDVAVGGGGSPDAEVGFNEAQATGVWDRAGSGLPGYRERTAYQDMNRDKGAKAVVFETHVPEDGTYCVAVAYPPEGNRASNVPVSIESADGTARVTLDERHKGTPFVFAPVGTYRFRRDQPARVRVGNEGTDGYVVVDAVRWVRVAP